MKKYLFLIISMFMALTSSADVTIDNITYILDDINMEAKVNTSLDGVAFPDNKVTIPGTFTRGEKIYTVTGVEAFSNKGAKMELVLPSSITYIKAVKSGIVTLNVPAAVTSITDMHESSDLQNIKVEEGNATYCDIDGVLFSKDKKTLFCMPVGRNSQANLSYTIPDGTEEISEKAFYKMAGLATIVFSNDVKTIGTSAFEGCTSLLAFSFSTNLKTIDSRAFLGCKSIPTLTFPASLEEVGANAFDGCTALTTIKFGEGLKTIKSYGFASCYALAYVEFPNSLETIEERAFWRTILNNVVLPDNLQTLGNQAFVWGNSRDDYSKHLQSLVIPAKVAKIGNCAFAGNDYYENTGDMTRFFTVDTIYAHMAPYVVPNNAFGTLTKTTLVVPKGMRDIYSTTNGWKNIPNIIEGDWEPEYDKSKFVIGDESIEEGMTINQDGITYKLYAKEGRQARLYSELTDYPGDIINIPEQLYYRANNYTVTGVEMFKSNRIVDLVLPNTVKTIQTIKSGIKTLNVPAGVTSITDMHESADLQDFKVDSLNATYCDVEGILYSKNKKTLFFMPYGRRTQENMNVTIPYGVETIESYAFYKMNNITRLQTNEELRKIGNNAFQGCTSISSLIFATGLKTIGAYNFAGCTGLARLTFPDGLEEIGKNAFDGCTNLTKVSFGEGLIAIRTYAFASCYALTTVNFPNSLEIIEDRAFWRTILNKVNLPENLQILGSQAFVWGNSRDDYSKHLQSLAIPAEVTKIGDCAFAGNDYYENTGDMTRFFTVDTVYSYIMEPMHINSNAFGTITNTVLVVPTGTREDYLLYNGWKDFGDRIEESAELLPTATRCATPVFTRRIDTLSISVQTEGATLYYTTDGKDPTEMSNLYEKPLVMTQNLTVKALAVRDGLKNSPVATYHVNWFKADDVEFEQTGLQIALSTKTENATIHYTLDGAAPTALSAIYSKPFNMREMTDSTKIRAVAMRKGYNDSDIADYIVQLKPVSCAMPTFKYSDNYVQISCITDGSLIYYTMDGREPTDKDSLYTTSISLDKNCTVKAIAIKDDFLNSGVNTLTVDWFTVGNVYFSLDNLQVKLTTETEGAIIRYTLDGSEPTTQSTIYQAPLKLNEGIKIRAFAMKPDYNSSQMTEYVVDFTDVTCSEPTFRRSGNQVVIETTTVDANIYYTTDGNEPTVNSTKYDAEHPITPEENCTIRAIVARTGFKSSQSASFKVDWMTVADVAIRVVNLQVEMTSETPDAIIHYTLNGDEPTEQSMAYQGMPLSIEDNCTIKAFAMKKNFINSGVTTYTLDWMPFTCAKPEIRLSGKQIVIETSTVGGQIYYTLDGTEPTENSSLYNGPVTATENHTVRAIVMKEGMRNSEMGLYQLDMFKVADVDIQLVNLKVEMKSATEGATIYYTLDGKEPNATSFVYQGVGLDLAEGSTVKAIGMKKNFNNSKTSTFTVNFKAITCAAPVFRKSGQNLYIATTTGGADIYYTTDGSDPTKESIKYADKVILTENCTVRAIVMKDGYVSSDITEYTVDWFTVADVEIEMENLQIVMRTATKEATIRYTLGEDDTPTESSTAYQNQPLSLEDGTTIKAIATKKNYNSSGMTTYKVSYAAVTCAKPEIRLSGKQIVMETTTADATVYYTLDGTEPTKQSEVYTDPVTLTKNCTVKAIAMRDGFRNSELGTLDVTVFTCKEPTFAVNGTTLTIKSDEGATIYYGIGENVEAKTLYEQAITLQDNQPIRAIAKMDGFNDSPVSEFTHSLINCQPATLENYNGRYFTLDVEQGAKVYYTLDGTEPTEDSEVYDGSTSVTERCTLKTLATKLWKNNSKVMTYELDYYFDGESLDLSEAGQLQKSLEWKSDEEVTTLNVKGTLNAADLSYIKNELKSLQHLDLSESTIEGSTLPDEAFAGMQLVSFISPNIINTVGNRIFADCDQLAAVVWNVNEKLPTSTFGDQVNPNLLLYVNNKTLAPTNVRNKVVNGTAQEILLTDAEGNNNFYCPIAFTAAKISYSHSYTMKTETGKCMGWETLALPFTVQKISTDKNGELTPYKKFEEDGSLDTARPFWLRSLTDMGFEDADTIYANVPYIICMPNSEEYAERYRIEGKVTFSATGANVPVTKETAIQKGVMAMVANFLRKDADAQIYAINKNDSTGEYPPGSTFVQDSRQVRPFEAYVTNSVRNAPAYLSLSHDFGNSGSFTGIMDFMLKSHNAADGSADVKVYNLSGGLVTSGKRTEVIKNLSKGVYIINGKKVIIK